VGSTSGTTDVVTAPGTASSFRPELQGLRALAVVAVILDHVLRWPSGGFVGVDIFFVLSGYLITGLVLREYEATGRVSFGAFYARRVRRILPTAVVVILATVLAGHFLFNSVRAATVLWDGVYSFLFVANWHFAASGTDYFQATGPTSPLQHFWSLSVEEQFYLVWPALMVLLLVAAVKLFPRASRSRLVLGVALAIIICGSFGYALWESSTNPTVAYFSTASRVWELGVGALLAVLAPLLARIPAVARGVLGWVGLAGVVASFFLITAESSFPGPSAAIPVAAAALIVVAGTGGPQRHLVLLGNPVSVFLGNISYSLYLWHFPVTVFLLLLMPDQSTTVTLAILGMILVLSVLSYLLVEQPLHRSPLFERLGGAEARSEAWQTWRDKFGSQFILATTGLIVVATVVVFAVGVSPRGLISEEEPAAAAPALDTDGIVAELQAELAAAVAATEWPDNLSPSLDAAIAHTSRDNPARECFNIGATPDVDRCTWGSADAPSHMYLVGDSEALTYAPAFKAIAEASGGQWKVTTIGLYGCRFTDALVQNDGSGVMEACAERKLDVADAVRTDAPQLIVVANAFAEGKTATGNPLSVSAMIASAAAETAKYNAPGKIVYLAAPPLGADLGQCYSSVSSPQFCNAAVGQTWQAFAAGTETTASATGDFFVSSLPFTCFGNTCPAFAGTLPTKYDTVHLTTEFSTRIAPAIQAALVERGLM
jgi:peptidoglycan/LPS O-acetylase OafA/YrhL